MRGIIFGGLHTLTTVDFPGCVSAIVFTQGCNFHCPYCHNPQLIPQARNEGAVSLKEVLAFLRKRAGLLDGLVISGGEPTLHTGLALLCRQAKDLGYRVKLDTNGSRPEVVSALVDQRLVDYIALDCKAAPEDYATGLCREKCVAGAVIRSIALVRASGVPHEFRTTCVSPFVSGNSLQALAGLVGDSPWYLQPATVTDGMQGRGVEALPRQQIEDLAAQARAWGAQVVIR